MPILIVSIYVAWIVSMECGLLSQRVGKTQCIVGFDHGGPWSNPIITRSLIDSSEFYSRKSEFHCFKLCNFWLTSWLRGKSHCCYGLVVFTWLNCIKLNKILVAMENLEKWTVAMLGGSCSQHVTGNTSQLNQPQCAMIIFLIFIILFCMWFVNEWF